VSNLANIRKQIEDRYPEMSPLFQKVARFILKEPSKIALYPIRQIAEMAGVSTSTVIRFVTLLEYDSYQSFRDAMREDLSSPSVSRYGVDANQLLKYRTGDSRGELWARISDTLVQHLVETHNSIPAAELQKVARLLQRARRVGVGAFSGMFAAAFYFHYVLNYLLSDVRLLEDRSSVFLQDLPKFGREDVVVIVSFEPYAAVAVDIAELCVANKIPHVAITDTPLSPVAKGAKHCLVVPVVGASFYQTLVPTFVIVRRRPSLPDAQAAGSI
jgi:DNA-binding MurR/RpiR family transcriptional regulator